MMNELGVPEGGLVDVRNARLPAGKFVKFRPLDAAFLSIGDPRAVCVRAFDVARCDALVWFDVTSLFFSSGTRAPCACACTVDLI